MNGLYRALEMQFSEIAGAPVEITSLIAERNGTWRVSYSYDGQGAALRKSYANFKARLLFKDDYVVIEDFEIIG